MANYVPFFRSSYFQVKGPSAFDAFCRKWAVRMVRGGKEDSLFGFLSDGEVGLPFSYYDAEKDDMIEGDFLKELSTHLAPGWVAIVREIGYEKMRYLVGYTIAVNAAGRSIQVSLDDIYEKAKRLGRHVTVCEY
jgi:hypothetical protein